jgi:hypothetical protein
MRRNVADVSVGEIWEEMSLMFQLGKYEKKCRWCFSWENMRRNVADVSVREIWEEMSLMFQLVKYEKKCRWCFSWGIMRRNVADVSVFRVVYKNVVTKVYFWRQCILTTMEATKLAPDVAIVIYILEVSGSSIGRDTNSCDRGLPCHYQLS